MKSSDERTALETMIAETTERFLSEQSALVAPALVVALVDDRQIVGTYFRGVLRDAGIGAFMPNADTRFRIASMTKSFTAAAVLRLRDTGALRLDDCLSELVPWTSGVVGPTTDSPPVTVRHLLTMSAGIASDDPWGDRQLDLPPAAFRDLVQSGVTFAFPPGSEWQYSNYGYALLGSVIESVTGRTAQQFISDEILRPLGMDSTGWSVPPLDMANVAWPTHRRDGLDVGAPLGDGAFAPMGGLWSTLNDLARWVGFLGDAFPARSGIDHAVLCRASRREMQRVHTSWAPKIVDSPYGQRQTELGYGMGIMVMEHPDLGTIAHHSGGLPGYGSNMRWIPDRGFGILALANRTYAPMRLLTAELIEVLNAADALPAPSRRWAASAPALEKQANTLVDWIWSLQSLAGCTEPDWAMNIQLDLPLAIRRAELDELVATVGPHLSRTFETESATSGAMTVSTASHDVKVGLMLSPEVPPKLEWFETNVLPRLP